MSDLNKLSKDKLVELVTNMKNDFINDIDELRIQIKLQKDNIQKLKRRLK